MNLFILFYWWIVVDRNGFTHCNAMDAAFWNAFNYHSGSTTLPLSLSLETILNYMYEREYNNYISCNTRGINSRTRMLTWNIINSPMAYILIENENQWSNLKRQCLFWIRITQAQQVRERILCTVRFHDWFAGKKWNFKKQPTHKS